MHNYVNNKLPQAFSHYVIFASDIHSYSTRHASKNLFVLPSTSNSGKFSVKLKGIGVWNNLSDEIRNFSYFKFKKYVKHSCFLAYIYRSSALLIFLF